MASFFRFFSSIGLINILRLLIFYLLYSLFKFTGCLYLYRWLDRKPFFHRFFVRVSGLLSSLRGEGGKGDGHRSRGDGTGI